MVESHSFPRAARGDSLDHRAQFRETGVPVADQVAVIGVGRAEEAEFPGSVDHREDGAEAPIPSGCGDPLASGAVRAHVRARPRERCEHLAAGRGFP